MTNYQPPLRDIRFALEVVGFSELAELSVFSHADPETFSSLLEQSGRFAANVLAPLNKIGDRQGAKLDSISGTVAAPEGWAAAYQQFRQTGWGAISLDPAHGGGGFPWLAGMAVQDVLTAANLAWCLCPQLTQGAIHMLQRWGDGELHETILRKMIAGEWTGTMAVSEPQSGSYVGALKATAEPAEDGTWRVSGGKIFITYGEHELSENIVHLVLARAPGAPPGMKGISCFIVPKYQVNDDGSLGDRNAVTCTAIERKLGLHASPTCALSFDNAVGYLIGEQHCGMRYMFTMMNLSRLGVALSGVAVAERAYQQAYAYAQERRQGRAMGAEAGTESPIAEHPDVQRMLRTMRAYIDAMRALVYTNTHAIDMANHHPDTDVRQANEELAEILTPVSKAWCTETACEVASLAMQVHGGAGYIEDTGAAQHYRDIRASAIYEGTNGVQGLDLVGRKLAMRAGAAVKDLIARMASLDNELADVEALGDIRAGLADGTDALDCATNWIFENGLSDPTAAMAAATPYLRIFGIVAGGWLIARQGLSAHVLSAQSEDHFLAEKLNSARYYALHILPQARGLLGAVKAGKQALFEPASSELAVV